MTNNNGVLNDLCMVNMNYMMAMPLLMKKNPCALDILCYIIENMDGNYLIDDTQKEIAEKIGRTVVSVSRSVQVLRQQGWIIIRKRGNRNSYMLNPSVLYKAEDNVAA